MQLPAPQTRCPLSPQLRPNTSCPSGCTAALWALRKHRCGTAAQSRARSAAVPPSAQSGAAVRRLAPPESQQGRGWGRMLALGHLLLLAQHHSRCREVTVLTAHRLSSDARLIFSLQHSEIASGRRCPRGLRRKAVRKAERSQEALHKAARGAGTQLLLPKPYEKEPRSAPTAPQLFLRLHSFTVVFILQIQKYNSSY